MLLRWIMRVGAMVAIAAISSVVTLFWVAFTPPKRVPAPLTANLGQTWQQAGDAFAERVTARFPIGSSEAEMTMELRRQGFSRQDWGSSTAEEHEAMRREDNGICAIAAYVYWRADADRHVTDIRGIYRNEGCL